MLIACTNFLLTHTTKLKCLSTIFKMQSFDIVQKVSTIIK